MGGEHAIVQMVYRAKKDALAADELISQYMNFIRSEKAGIPTPYLLRAGMMSLALPCLHFMRLFRDINGGEAVFFPMLLLPSATVWLIIIEKRNATRGRFPMTRHQGTGRNSRFLTGFLPGKTG